MAKSYNFLNVTQEDINRRLLRKIEALEKSLSESGYDDTDVKNDIKSLETRVKALEDAE